MARLPSVLRGCLGRAVGQAESSKFESAKCGSSPAWNRQGPSRSTTKLWPPASMAWTAEPGAVGDCAQVSVEKTATARQAIDPATRRIRRAARQKAGQQ